MCKMMRAQKLKALKVSAFGKCRDKIIALCQVSRKKLWRKMFGMKHADWVFLCSAGGNKHQINPTRDLLERKSKLDLKSRGLCRVPNNIAETAKITHVSEKGTIPTPRIVFFTFIFGSQSSVYVCVSTADSSAPKIITRSLIYWY